MYKIELFEQGRQKPIEDFIASLSDTSISKIRKLFDLLIKYGPYLGMPYSKKIVKNLFELRIRGQEVRLFYTVKGKSIRIIHGIKKKTQKIPMREINLCIKRLQII